MLTTRPQELLTLGAQIRWGFHGGFVTVFPTFARRPCCIVHTLTAPTASMPPDSRVVPLDALPGPAQVALVRSLGRNAGRLRLVCRAWRGIFDVSVERLQLIAPFGQNGAIAMEPLLGLLRRCGQHVRSVEVQNEYCIGHVGPVLAALSTLPALRQTWIPIPDHLVTVKPTRQPWTGRPVGPCRESDAA